MSEKSRDGHPQSLGDKFLATGLTFDDVLIAPRYSEVVPSEVDVRSPTASPALSSPQTRPRTTSSGGNITTPKACRTLHGSCRC